LPNLFSFSLECLSPMIDTKRIFTTLAGFSTFGIISVASSAASGLTLTGGFGFSGTANLSPEVGTTNPASVIATFDTRFFDAASGSFADIIPSAGNDGGNTFDFMPNPLTFNQTADVFYTSEELLIDFGMQTIGGITEVLTVTVASNLFLRNSDNMSLSSSMVNVGQISAIASFDGMDTLLSGSYSVNDTQSADGTFALSFTAVPSASVPEPSTNATLLALGVFGAGLMIKRTLTNKF
jgi:hypothetical protein